MSANVLDERIHAGGATKRFGDLTLDDVAARAEELRSATGWGPTARVAPVARAWADLAQAMRTNDAATVAELDPDDVAARAQRLWIVPPGGSLL